MDTRELDARVAREVMGFEIESRTHSGKEYLIEFVRHKENPIYHVHDGILSDYSTDMNAAMEIEQKMHDLGWCSFTLVHHHPGGTWTAMFMNCGVLAEAEAETAAVAICLAALEAVGGKDKE